MSVGRHSIKIYQGERYLRRFTQLTEEYSETVAEIDVGQHGKILVTEIATWGHPLNDFSWRYVRMKIRDGADDTLLATLTEDNLRLRNMRTAGTIILDMHSNETAALDFTRGNYDLELVQHSLVASGSYGASCAVDVLDADATQNTGDNNPGTTANNTNTGHVEWSDLANVGADDATHATAALNDQYTDSADITNFSFDLGMGTSIDGIEVIIDRKASVVARIKDYTVQLLKNGEAVGDNDADTSTLWPNTDTPATYGSSSSLWGTTWTAHDISNHKFGVRIQAIETTAADTTASIDHVTIKIYFSGTGQLTAASGTPFNGWSAADLIHIATSENDNEGIYKIHSVTDTEIFLTAPLHGTDNADDETIVISKVTLDETDVVKFVRGSVTLYEEDTY